MVRMMSFFKQEKDLEGKDPEEEKKETVNPKIEAVFEEYGIDKEAIKGIFEKVLLVPELELFSPDESGKEVFDYEIVSCLGNEIVFIREANVYEVACWEGNKKDVNLEKIHENKLKFRILRKTPESIPYLVIEISFPKYFWRHSKRAYLNKGANHVAKISSIINELLKDVLGENASQI